MRGGARGRKKKSAGSPAQVFDRYVRICSTNLYEATRGGLRMSRWLSVTAVTVQAGPLGERPIFYFFLTQYSTGQSSAAESPGTSCSWLWTRDRLGRFRRRLAGRSLFPFGTTEFQLRLIWPIGARWYRAGPESVRLSTRSHPKTPGRRVSRRPPR